jgi:small basic protein
VTIIPTDRKFILEEGVCLMGQLSVKTRLLIAFIWDIILFIGIAYLQLLLGFNTYVAMVLCIIGACIFGWIVMAG